MESTEKLPKWSWCPNMYDLRKTDCNDSEISFNCAPYVLMCSSSSAGEPQELELMLNIRLERTFEYDTKHGWTWHKNWVLPSIELTASVRRVY